MDPLREKPHQNKSTIMNTLQRLFSPRTLATTVAAGMFMHTAVAYIAAECISVSASTVPMECGAPYHHLCLSGPYYYCCPSGYECAGAFLDSQGRPWGKCSKDGGCG
jgi:hypothetical protein